MDPGCPSPLVENLQKLRERYMLSGGKLLSEDEILEYLQKLRSGVDPDEPATRGSANMPSESFNAAIEKVLRFEGGYVNDPVDPGGETNYGIAKRFYPALDIRSLTLDRAKEIYYSDYWPKVRGDELPPRLAVVLFDTCVNCGAGRAIGLLQNVCNLLGSSLEEDGAFGPATMSAVMSNWYQGEDEFIGLYTTKRIAFYLSLVDRDPAFRRFIRGWVRRASSFWGK